MAVTVTDVMREVRTCFPHARMEGTFTLSGGVLTPQSLLLSGDWVALRGSLLNDGVYCLQAGGVVPGARDETWHGEVWLLRPPEDFLRLCGEIAEWEASHSRDDVRSERFGAYAVERCVDANGLPMDWRDVFRARLTPWRHMFPEEGLTC